MGGEMTEPCVMAAKIEALEANQGTTRLSLDRLSVAVEASIRRMDDYLGNGGQLPNGDRAGLLPALDRRLTAVEAALAADRQAREAVRADRERRGVGLDTGARRRSDDVDGKARLRDRIAEHSRNPLTISRLVLLAVSGEILVRLVHVLSPEAATAFVGLAHWLVTIK
jgi:hypothetical protein